MTIERIKGKLAFHCDLEGCHEGLETDTGEFSAAKDRAKAEGWQFRNREGAWKQFCSSGHETMEYRGQKLTGKGLL